MAEYEPDDSRNITGTTTTKDGRWTNNSGKPPKGVPDEKRRVRNPGAAGKA